MHQGLWDTPNTNQGSEQTKMPKPTLALNPTPTQVEKLRLILSTYQDGTGQNDGGTAPGWRDFERAVAAAFNGQAQESKHVFDVIVPTGYGASAYGISCKMRGELGNTVARQNKKGLFKKGRVSMELSNSAKYFWTQLKKRGINETVYKVKPVESGIALIELVKSWHNDVSLEKGSIIDLSKSFYLVLQWDKSGLYQLFQYSIHLPDPKELKWHFPPKTGKNGEEESSLRLAGEDSFGSLFEWYGDTGGQLKYYPLTEDALWKSDKFRLEPLPTLESLEYGIIAKAKTYFPRQWSSIAEDV